MIRSMVAQRPEKPVGGHTVTFTVRRLKPELGVRATSSTTLAGCASTGLFSMAISGNSNQRGIAYPS